MRLLLVIVGFCCLLLTGCATHNLFTKYVDEDQATKLDLFWSEFNVAYNVSTPSELDSFLLKIQKEDLYEIAT